MLRNCQWFNIIEMKCEMNGVVVQSWSQMIQNGRAWSKVEINKHIETIPIPQEWLDKMPKGTLIKITLEIPEEEEIYPPFGTLPFDRELAKRIKEQLK